MKNLLTSIILLLLLTSPLFGQSSEDKKFAVRTSIFAHALTYNLDKQNGDNIEKGVNSFIGVNYGYAFNCINCDSFSILTLLSTGNATFTTDDGSTYNYSGWGINVVGAYGWYFENDLSVILGLGPSYGSWSKESENLKSDKGYGNDVEDRVKKLSFQPISSTPFLAIGYSF
ncbi:MAG TPA: hypothetical protein EYQ48_10650 [Candidatus Lambdaproteobacteria bacterium]|nr:hypothetical protein [Candidatus Lambdaproteobacteria bacterium]